MLIIQVRVETSLVVDENRLGGLLGRAGRTSRLIENEYRVLLNIRRGSKKGEKSGGKATVAVRGNPERVESAAAFVKSLIAGNAIWSTVSPRF